MRKLDLPEVDDVGLLEELRKARGKSAKSIRPQLQAIQIRYGPYSQQRGNPWSIPQDAGFLAVRDALHNLYERPPVALTYIKPLRQSSIKGACPVCGRDALGTLDHYLPKANYAEFSFFSPNLIPACDRCNNFRNNLAMGQNHGERPVHPYYDDFAGNRVMTVRFEPDWRAPLITPVPFNVVGDELLIVQWHINNIIRPSGIDNYLDDLWGVLVGDPRLVFDDVTDIDAMVRDLQKQVRIETANGRSHNAWRACFYHGLSLNIEALEYFRTLVPTNNP